MNLETIERLELLLHALLNGGTEVGKIIREHCSDNYMICYETQKADIMDELDELNHLVKIVKEELE